MLKKNVNSPIKISEGKTKIIWATDNPKYVRIESKDDITAGDGIRKDSFKEKGKIVTDIAINVFKLLDVNKIPQHFIKRDSTKSFIAKRVKMIVLECVARRVASGSYLYRYPRIKEGKRFNTPIVEFYIKDDKKHDPLFVYTSGFSAKLYNAKDEIKLRKSIGTIRLPKLDISPKDLNKMTRITRKVFRVIEKAWESQNIMLVDLKIEFGKDEMGDIIVADVIDNDGWRIWPKGDKSQMLDKQSYRNGESLELVAKNYKKVAKMTKQFI